LTTNCIIRALKIFSRKTHYKKMPTQTSFTFVQQVYFFKNIAVPEDKGEAI